MRPLRNSTAIYFVSLLLVFQAGNAFGQLGLPSFGSKGKSDDQRESKLLHDNLPLALDANDAYPTVPDGALLGGPFRGRVLPITLDTLTKPLPPGDYVVPMTFFCSEYSVHRGGRGVAYTLGPAKGSASTAISTLLWRGMLTGHSPQELQAVSWAIQGSVPYVRMPANYKTLVDQLIPDMRAEVNGQGWTKIQTGMQGTVNRGAAKVSETLSKGLGAITGGKGHVTVQVRVQMDQKFEQLGRLGKMAIDGENISDIVQASYPSDQARNDALFAGQGGQAPPIPAMDGPWSVIVPGVAYMRFIVQGGNLQGDNFMQIRVLAPRTSAVVRVGLIPHLLLTSYQQPAPMSNTLDTPSLLRMFGGAVDLEKFLACSVVTEGFGDLGPCEALAIKSVAGVVGYAINTGAQAPIMVPTDIARATKAAGDNGGVGSKSGSETGDNNTGARGLPPKGKVPPVDNPESLTIKEASRPSEQAKGGKSLWDDKGGEWRYHEDQRHNPHWDYNAHDKKGSPWQVIPIDGKPHLR